MSILTVIDDVDPAITYSAGDWTLSNPEGAIDGTVHSTDTVNATATVSFSSSAENALLLVLGTIPFASDNSTKRTNSTYSLDGSNPSKVSISPVPFEQGGEEGGLFFSTKVATPGQHQLVITYTGGNTYILDNLVIQQAGKTSGKKVNGAAIGAGIGVGLLFLGIFAGLIYLYRDRKRRIARRRQQEDPPLEMGDSPLIMKRLN
ncbi:hypothetical protein C8J56DRAFT_937468 [Mycena floridula]|nr:hypothetical protein C8J56DRAFT_937468 [Mycena floridula]